MLPLRGGLAIMVNGHSVADLSCGGTTRRFYFRGATSDEQVAKDVFQQQEYSLNRLRRASELIAFAKEQERRGRRPLIVDAGANIGATALYFTLTFPNSSVVAVEPDHENFNLLSKNTQGLRVKAHHAAVSANKGRVSVFDPGEGHWGYRTRPAADGEVDAGSVPCLMINDLYDAYGSDHFPFIVTDAVAARHKDHGRRRNASDVGGMSRVPSGICSPRPLNGSPGRRCSSLSCTIGCFPSKASHSHS